MRQATWRPAPATSSGDVEPLQSEEAVDHALRMDSDQEEEGIVLINAEELRGVHYLLPTKITGLVFRKETDMEHEVSDVQNDPLRALKTLKQNNETTMLGWEMQVEECVEGEEDDDFRILVSSYRKTCCMVGIVCKWMVGR